MRQNSFEYCITRKSPGALSSMCLQSTHITILEYLDIFIICLEIVKIMSSKQEQLRIRVKSVVKFYNDQMDDKLKKTVKHFLAEKVPRSSIYRIINNFIIRKTINRKAGSGRIAKIMTSQMRRKFVEKFNDADGISQRQEDKLPSFIYQ